MWSELETIEGGLGVPEDTILKGIDLLPVVGFNNIVESAFFK
jgi:hypothetical protein